MQKRLALVYCFLGVLTAILTVDAGNGFMVAADTLGTSSSATPTIADFTKGMTRLSGFLTLYRQDSDGGLYLEIPASGTPDLLYQATLASGFGQRLIADGGGTLDRGYFGPTRLVTFRRFGGKVLLLERNVNYFTPSSAFGSVADTGYSFPDSVVAAFNIKAREADVLLLDATSFFRHDDIGVAAVLKANGQGSFALDDKLSSVDRLSAKTSDQGIDVEAFLTFSTSDARPGENDLLSDVAANRNALLIREHHSFYRLADVDTSQYQPRAFDARAGYFDDTFQDPSRPVIQSLRQSYICRHLLKKKRPGDLISEPEKPIIFYIDPSVPTELHSSITEAVLWWAPAFEAAGFRNTLEVRELPSDLDPLSVGANIITWVQRATHGWSYGSLVVDPRTGQILKALVRLDGMRLRADRVLFDALTNPYTDQPDLATRDAALRQRFKLLVAHEVGHALGPTAPIYRERAGELLRNGLPLSQHCSRCGWGSALTECVSQYRRRVGHIHDSVWLSTVLPERRNRAFAGADRTRSRPGILLDDGWRCGRCRSVCSEMGFRHRPSRAAEHGTGNS